MQVAPLLSVRAADDVRVIDRAAIGKRFAILVYAEERKHVAASLNCLLEAFLPAAIAGQAAFRFRALQLAITCTRNAAQCRHACLVERNIAAPQNIIFGALHGIVEGSFSLLDIRTENHELARPKIEGIKLFQVLRKEQDMRAGFFAQADFLPKESAGLAQIFQPQVIVIDGARNAIEEHFTTNVEHFAFGREKDLVGAAFRKMAGSLTALDAHDIPDELKVLFENVLVGIAHRAELGIALFH